MNKNPKRRINFEEYKKINSFSEREFFRSFGNFLVKTLAFWEIEIKIWN
jgi:hypothetical protein